MLPSARGYKAAPGAADQGITAMATECRGAATLLKSDATSRTLAGTQTTLLELGATAWTDVSKGGGYVGGPDTLWRFAQYGLVSIATNRADPVQSSSSGAFADLAGTPPKATFVDTASNFVLLADTSEATFGDQPDRWWCSGLGNHLTWTPSLATQAASNRLLSTPGPIRASKHLGDYWAIYKLRSLYLGQYTGPPSIWAFTVISETLGAVSQEAVVDVGYSHYAVGHDEIYVFDGSRPQPISGAIKEYFYGRLNKAFSFKVKGIHDQINSLIYWFYPNSSSSGELNDCIVYSYRFNKWGIDARGIQWAFEFIPAGITFDGFGAWVGGAGTWNTTPAAGTISFDSPTFFNFNRLPAFVGTDRRLYTLTGAPGASTMKLTSVGDDNGLSLLRKVVPRYESVPTMGTIKDHIRQRLGAAPSLGSGKTLIGGRYDVLRSGRWHELELAHDGDVDLSGIDVDLLANGLW